MSSSVMKATLGTQLALALLAMIVGSIAVAFAAVAFSPPEQSLSTETKFALQQSVFALGILLATFAFSIVIVSSINLATI